VTYTRFVSVSIDPPEVAAAFRAGLDARWTFLSDAERRYQAELGLRETTDTVQRPYRPASFLLFPDLSIHQVWNGYWF
jgi:peroxiredoxin